MLTRTDINIAIVSTISAGLCTILFAIAMFAELDMFSYSVCLVLSLCYLIMVTIRRT
jgi:hypothetical protein